MKLLFMYVAVLGSLVVLDSIWLTFTKSFAQRQIGHLFAPHITWWAVVLFYLLYAAAVVYFAVLPAASVQETLIRGALLGLTAYMTYDLVNLSTLAGWPLTFSLADMTWGAVITAVAACMAALI